MKPRFDSVARWTLQVVMGVLSFCAMLLLRGTDAWAEGLIVADATTLVDLNEAMKIIFEDSVFDNTVHDSELLDQFEMDDRVMVEETTGGRYIETAQYFQLPAGVRSVASGDYIPVPDGPVIKNSRVYLKKIQGVVEMLGDVMRRVRTNEGAFLDWGERALPDLVSRLDDLMDRQMLGFGSGILARVASADTGSGTDILIDRSFGVDGLTDGFLNMLEGKRVVFSSAADGDPLRDSGTSAQVTDATSGQITVSARPTGVVTDDYIFDGDDIGAAIPTSGGEDREFMGLLGMIDDGGVLATFQNIVRANFRKWQSVVIDSTTDGGGFGGELSEDLLAYADDQTFVLGGGKIDLFVTNRAANRQYWRKLRGDRTLPDPRGQYEGGLTGTHIRLGDRRLPIKVARKMPPQLAFGVQKNTFKRWQLGRWEWDDTTGSIWNRATDATGRKDAYYAVGHLYIQMGCFAPRKNFRIDALTP